MLGLGHLLVSPWILVILAGAILNLVVAGLAIGVSSAPGWRDQRPLVLLAVAAAIYSFCDMHTCVAPLPVLVRQVAAGLTLAMGSCMIAAWLMYAAAVRSAPLSQVDRVVASACLGAGLVSLVPGVAWSDEVVTRLVPSLGLMFWDLVPTGIGDVCLGIYALGLVVLCIKQALDVYHGVPYAKYLALAIGMMAVAVTHDMLVTSLVFTSLYMAEVGFMAALITLAIGFSRRFIAAAAELEALTLRLEARVEERGRELEQTHLALAKAERLGAVGQLAAGVAHEINNPAGAIAANLEYLGETLERRGALDAELRVALADSTASIRRISRIVRQLLDAGRVAAQGVRPEATTSLVKVVETSVETARATPGPPARFELDVADVYVKAEAYFLEQVLTNLVVNAVQSVPQERRPVVRIRTEVTSERVLVEIQDNGLGMSEDARRRIGEPFFSTKPVGQGTGLGLAVSFGLVKAMGGTLSFESEVGVGTTARLELLLAESAAVEPVIPSATLERGRRLLLIDDDTVVLRSLVRALSSRFEVTGAETVLEAQGYIERCAFDVIICDVMMPDGGAATLDAWLRAHRPELIPRTIFLTGGASTSEAREFLASSTRPVLKKPFSQSELDELVCEIAAQEEVLVDSQRV